MVKLKLPSAKVLNDFLNYDPETGILTWKMRPSNRVKIGEEAGRILHDRVEVGFMKKRYFANRLIWRMVTGEDPGNMQVDHIDVNPLNNRWDNLRLATQSSNNHNMKKPSTNTSGVKGVSWCSERKMWKAQLCTNGKRKHIGRFVNKEDATEAIREYREKMHGEFHNHG